MFTIFAYDVKRDILTSVLAKLSRKEKWNMSAESLEPPQNNVCH